MRKIEGLLLKERWSLIRSGVNRKSIKLCKNKLLVDNKLFGSDKFELSGATKQQAFSITLECNELSGTSKQSKANPSGDDSPAECATDFHVEVPLSCVSPQSDSPLPKSPQGLFSHGGGHPSS